MDRSATVQTAQTPHPTTIMTVVLKLALNPGARFASGRPDGYAITAPLNDPGFLDVAGRPHRHWPVRPLGGTTDKLGWLVHRGSSWFIDYDDSGLRDDEAVFRLSDHPFVVGEFVTVTSHRGEPLTYRVTRVEPASDAEGESAPA